MKGIAGGQRKHTPLGYLRIYQNNEKIIFVPTSEDILPIMDTIVHFNNILKEIQEDI